MDNMKISRYIKFPLSFGLLMVLACLLSVSHFSFNEILGWFVLGAVCGIGMQFYSDYRTRKIKPDAEEKDFVLPQKRETFLLCSYDEAFDLCLESVSHLRKGKVKTAAKEKGFIKAKTGMNWNSWGNIIEFKLKQLTENLTEIEIFAKPIPGTTLIDNGTGLEAIETIQSVFNRKMRR
ncbi:MAG: hypothetical protein HC846_00880 [Blastocatellia bacterium]|nr:hypothetical protein [Blastocatellia bacterium]